jgi:hypothetical protein
MQNHVPAQGFPSVASLEGEAGDKFMEIPPESVSLDPVEAQHEPRVATMRGTLAKAGQLPPLF